MVTARSIRVALGTCGNSVYLHVMDDGAGFAVPAQFDRLALNGPLGLAGLGHRIAMTAGQLSVVSKPGGTIVRPEVPSMDVRP